MSATATGGAGGAAAPCAGGAAQCGAAGSSARTGAAGSGGASPIASGGASGSGSAGTSSSGGGGTGGTAGSSGDAGGTGASGTGGTGGSGGTGGGGAGTSGGDACAPAPSELVGWATIDGNGVSTTTGGEGGPTVSVNTLSALQDAVKSTDKRVIEISGTIKGDISIGSNKTLKGCSGARVQGHIGLNKSQNVIIRNLTVVGYNCTDNTSDCSAGADAITVQGASHHLWFDHDDISDGSDGNLDLTHATDFVTISFTKFHYSGRRTDPAGAAGGHQFSNLIGHSDSNASEDTGHLRITFHHDWWADNVVERMPRVRFGQVHLFDNLYTASGNDYCIGVGYGANILAENNVFVGVKTPIDTTTYSNSASVIHSAGNVYTSTSGAAPADLSAGNVFKPPYTYALEATSALQTSIETAAGPH
ncbi:MAG: polysaccharide lyase family 1 protein [Polyangiales bacterium]